MIFSHYPPLTATTAGGGFGGFGATAPNTVATTNSGFSFGSSSTMQSSGGLSFGAPAATGTGFAGFGASTAPATGFGASTAPATATGGFGAGTAIVFVFL